jgi:cell division protease FtsH
VHRECHALQSWTVLAPATVARPHGARPEERQGQTLALVKAMNSERKRTLWYLPVLLGLGAMWLVLLSRADAELPYSEFKTKLAAGEVESVTVSPTLVQGRLVATAGAKTGAAFQSVRVDDPKLLEQLEAHGVKVRGEHESRAWPLIASAVPFVVVALLLTFATRGLGKQGGLLTVGRSKAKLYVEKQVEVGFGDVVGVDEAKDELREVVEFLRTPDKFRRLGGQLPRGILLVGPPGTGKTLLARAVAGEAGVPFFSISGSEFVEMFVGVGAARVRDLFTQARERAPCIIFIDELDALGKARGLGPNSHDEREQTLNQLLVELDGFDPRAGVILMAATNRPEILDPALLRAGRFDRHVLLDRPDRTGRLAILQLHARKVTLGKDVDLEVIASMTAGMVGADLANVINEAALLAVRRGKDAVGPSELQEAVERIIAGLEKRSRVLTPLEKERVAHHEIGHALLALTVPGLGAIQKISVIPRGIAALGYTLQLPTEDRFLMTQRELEDKIMVLLGGRIAEELSFGDPSTGAQDDLRKATDLARSMVRAFAMGRGLGHVSFERQPRTLLGEPTGGSERGEQSEQVTDAIDAEVRRIIEEQYVRAKRTLAERRDLLRKAAELLLARETISGAELMALAGAPAAQAA